MNNTFNLDNVSEVHIEDSFEDVSILTPFKQAELNRALIKTFRLDCTELETNSSIEKKETLFDISKKLRKQTPESFSRNLYKRICLMLCSR